MLAYSLAILIGLILGLLGGGGSILTVPILVYILGIDPKEAVALSLFIIGITSLVGSIGHFKNKNINFKISLIFTPIAMIGTFFGTKLAFYLTGSTQLIIFAIVMILASTLMLKKPKYSEGANHRVNYYLMTPVSFFVGVLTGIVGVGGGFLIVPALVLIGRVDMKKAVGSSLLIISVNSLSGFLNYLNSFEIDWGFLASFSTFTVIGILIGTKLIKYIPAQGLKKAFAIFLIIMGIFILYKNKNKLESKTSYIHFDQIIKIV